MKNVVALRKNADVYGSAVLLANSISRLKSTLNDYKTEFRSVRDASYKISKNLISNFGLFQDEATFTMLKTDLNSNT